MTHVNPLDWITLMLETGWNGGWVNQAVDFGAGGEEIDGLGV